MDILSKINIVSNFSKDYSKTTPLFFYNDYREIQEIPEEEIPEFKEYNELLIKHSGSANERLYFDAFETIEHDNLNRDEYGDLFLNNNEVPLIEYNQNSSLNTLVPGYYVLKLKSDKIYYSLIEIIPKDLDKVEWKLLYEEVNNFINGLAQSYLNKSNTNLTLRYSKANIYDQINYILKSYKIILRALKEIADNPRFNIQKNYDWTYIGNQSRIDNISIKKYLQNHAHKNHMYSYKKQINYNLTENRWLKGVIYKLSVLTKDLLKKINDSISFYDLKRNSKYLSDILISKYTLKDLKKIKDKITIIHYSLETFKQKEWFNEISNFHITKPTNAALMNSDYNTIYKWYSQLNNKKLNFVLSKTISNSWKRTDELYEIWCFIKILGLLQKDGFTPISGWVYDKEFNDDLEDNTFVTLTKENLKINLHYNSEMKKNSIDTTLDHPLYTSHSKNKPDIRLDLFIDKKYFRSIPIDVKYRKLNNIIKGKYNSTEQLYAYLSSPRSKLHLGEDKNGDIELFKKNSKVVTAVLVLYPLDSNKKNSRIKNNLTNDHDIIFFETDIYSFNNKILDFINESIDEIKELNYIYFK